MICYRYLIRMRTIFCKSQGVCFLGLFFILSQPCMVRAAKITDVRIWSAPDHVRVVVDLTDAVTFESASQSSPPQFHLTLNASLQFRRKQIDLNNPFLTKVDLNDSEKGKVKLVFHQKRPLQVDLFPLKPYMDKPHRLVIDLLDPVEEKKEQDERQRQKEVRTKETKIVVLDPGHGGEDPGAIGQKKTMEKDIVLQVGGKIAQLLNQNHSIKTFLTRKGDYFVPLENRVKIARDYGADLFVSLHTDGSFNPNARGSSVYLLSLSGATDETAKILADKENMSNVLGGAVLRPAAMAKDPNLNQILLDLMINNSMRESQRFSGLLLDEVSNIHRIKYKSHREANFIVLRSADIPSVLLEMAYVTNREDERLLTQPEFQDKMARTVAATVTRFFKP
jgi:N-acetylmuramoyl-L-alanine amidase